MPHKGFYTQGLVILLRQAASLDAIAERLGDFDIVKRRAQSSEYWAIGGPTLIVAYKPDVNGYVAIDLCDQRWPDSMGDPKAEPEIFAAWSTGHFGPGAWPGNLERSCQHSWKWPDGRTVPLQHQAFIRIRCSYVFGADDDTPIMPKSYDALDELRFVTRLAAALVRLPDALCFFNPSGECVRGGPELLAALEDHAAAARLPLDIWSNVRFFTFRDVDPAWSLMDTVGMVQLDAPDHEAFFQLDAYEPGEVGAFLRNVSVYVIEQRPEIRDGDTIDGPGNVRWQGVNRDESRMVPPRQVIRWLPLDGRRAPPELLEAPKPS
jgi:hypothetical protein